MGKLGDAVKQAIKEGVELKTRASLDRAAKLAKIQSDINDAQAKIMTHLERDLPFIIRKASSEGLSQVRIHSLKDWGGGTEACLPPVDLAVLRALRAEGLDVFIDYDLSGNARSDHALALRIVDGQPSGAVDAPPSQLLKMIDELPDELLATVENYCRTRARRSK